MSLFTLCPSRGVPLPANSQRVVYLFRLSGRTLATRLLVLPTGIELADYSDYSQTEPLYWAFTRAHLQARAGTGNRLLGELRLCRDLAELESVATVVFHLCDYSERNWHGTQAECATLAGHLAGMVYEELGRWGVSKEITRRRMTQVQRGEEADQAVFRFWLNKKDYAVRLRLSSDEGNDVPAREEPFALSAYPFSPGDVRLSRGVVGFDDILQQVYPLVARLRRRRCLDDHDGGTVCGELVACILLELDRLGIPFVARTLTNPSTCIRARDKWKLLPG